MLPAAVAGTLPRPQAIARASVSALVASLPLLYVSLLRPPPAALAGDTAFWFLMSNCVIAAIVATSADAGTLLFRSSAPDDDDDHPCCFDGGGGGISCPAAVHQLPPVAAQGIVASGDDAVVPLPASSQDQTVPAVDVDVDVNGAGRVQEEAASAVTSSCSIDHALPTLIEGEEDEEEEEEGTIEPTTAKNNTVEVVEPQGEENTIEVIPLATIEEGSALADPDDELEPWSRVVLTSTKSLPEEEGGAAAAREGGLRRSATVGSAPAADEESEYWQLSDEELNRRVEDFIARFNREMRLQIEQEARV